MEVTEVVIRTEGLTKLYKGVPGHPAASGAGRCAPGGKIGYNRE